MADDADIQQAIAAARRAFDESDWPWRPAGERAALLTRTADLLERDRAEIARLETLNTGKALRESEYDVDDVISVFRYYAGLADKEAGRLVATTVSAHGFAPKWLFHTSMNSGRSWILVR